MIEKMPSYAILNRVCAQKANSSQTTKTLRSLINCGECKNTMSEL